MSVKKKIAFVVTRYGKDINGGAEYHCRMLAERLKVRYEVEVLTTCVRNYQQSVNELPEGAEWLNGVLVRRFKVDPIQADQHEHHLQRLKPARKLRRLLFRLHLLRMLANVVPVWSWKKAEELAAFRSDHFYSPSLNAYVEQHQADYHCFLPINMVESPCFFTGYIVPHKTIVIPTLHCTGTFFWSVQTEVMTRVSYVAFNTTAEQRLGQHIWGRKLARHGVIGVGIEEPVPADWKATQHKYHLPDDYLLYVGRIEPGKLQHISDDFMVYKQRVESSLKLVLVGSYPADYRRCSSPDVVYTGFVTDEEKRVILQHAKIVVNPSLYESLSLIVLEAMHDGKPLLVNGRCEVLKEHCVKSKAALYYTSRRSFINQLQRLDVSPTLRGQLSQRGRSYVNEHYAWPLVLQRMIDVIESIQ